MDHFEITEDYFTQKNHELIKSRVMFSIIFYGFIHLYVMKFAHQR